MQSRRWTVRAAILGAVVAAFAAFGASAAYAVGSPTVTTIASSANPSPACGTVTLTATVHGILLPPLGFVQFFDGASTLGGIRALGIDGGFLGLPTSHSSASIAASLSVGPHLITAVYAGTDIPSTGTLAQVVSGAVTSSTTVASSVDPSVYGQSVSFTATVASSCRVSGTVQFQADGAALGSAQAVDGGGHASVPTAALAAGTHPITAVFSSDNTDVAGSSGSLAGGQIVNAADTTTNVSSGPSPAEFGAAVVLSATTTVNAPGAGTATGTVQFRDNGTDLGAPQPVGGGGPASLTTTALGVGIHAITAAYTSDSPNFNSSSGSTTQTIERARTTLRYDGSVTSDYDDPTVLSATLTRTDNSVGIAGKTVTLSMGAESCIRVTDLTGAAACTVTPAEPAGPYAAVAGFVGDGNYLASVGGAPFTVTREETTTAYTGPTVIAQGSPVMLSGRLLEDGATAIAGRTLTLTLGSGASSQSCTTGPTDAAGNAQCVLTNVVVSQGPNPVTAEFAGDAFYLPSVDAGKSVIVFAFPSRGVFVIGDRSAAGSTPVAFWGAQWAKLNATSGGSPSAFKGFVDTLTSKPPVCGGSWTSSPGNSSSPVEAVPAYMGTTVSSAITQNGSTISGTITKIVVVRTAPGYAPDPGKPGTGTIVATYC